MRSFIVLWTLSVWANSAFALAAVCFLSARRSPLLYASAISTGIFTWWRLLAHALGWATLDGWILTDQAFVLLEIAAARDLMRPHMSQLDTLCCQSLWAHVAVICLEYDLAEGGQTALANTIYTWRAWACVAITAAVAATIWQKHQTQPMETVCIATTRRIPLPFKLRPMAP